MPGMALGRACAGRRKARHDGWQARPAGASRPLRGIEPFFPFFSGGKQPALLHALQKLLRAARAYAQLLGGFLFCEAGLGESGKQPALAGAGVGNGAGFSFRATETPAEHQGMGHSRHDAAQGHELQPVTAFLSQSKGELGEDGGGPAFQPKPPVSPPPRPSAARPPSPAR